MARTYEPIASQTLGSNTTTVTFSSIPATMTDLIVVAYYNASTGTPNAKVRVGNAGVDSGSNYSNTLLYGTGSAAASGRQSSSTELSLNWSQNITTTSHHVSVLHIQSYANTNVFKTLLMSTGSASLEVIRTVGLWRSTSAITDVSLFTASQAFASGSTFALYGIKAA